MVVEPRAAIYLKFGELSVFIVKGNGILRENMKGR